MRFTAIRVRSLRKGIPFKITIDDYLRLWETSSKVCPILGTKLDFQNGRRGANPDTLPSLDKNTLDLGT